MASLSIRSVKKSLGGTPILRGIDLSVADGELVVLVGPSGCGKSTLLRAVAGLGNPDTGTIQIGNRDVTRLPPRERDVAMVFQSYALYPHLTVRENLAFGLRLRRTERSLVEQRIAEVAKMLGLDRLLERYPRQLSGGQRQRVAMGRAIARRPALFLFDEPLSNLDAALRSEVRVEIKRLHASLGATIIYVTHDQVEAMTLADRLVVLNGGLVEQAGSPLEVYKKPATRFVASFIGSPSMNFVDAEILDGRARAAGIDLPTNGAANGPVCLGVRPHDVVPSDRGAIELKVDVVEAMGFESFAHGSVGTTPFVARLDAEHPVRPGETIRLDVPKTALHLFDPGTGRTL